MFRQGWDLQLTEYGDGHLARDLLRECAGALHRRWDSLGASRVDGGAAGGVGRA
jgi:hypothetical protein